MKEIVLYPGKILRAKTPRIAVVDKKLLEEIDEVRKYLASSAETAAGLAATQLGYKRSFFGLKMDKKKKLEIFINPKIRATYGKLRYPLIVRDDGREEVFLEGCLSFPDLFGEVKRYMKIEVEWEEVVSGELVKRQRILTGFEAIVFQHETEHLGGILFVDHIKEDGGKIYRWVGDHKTEIKINGVIKD